MSKYVDCACEAADLQGWLEFIHHIGVIALIVLSSFSIGLFIVFVATPMYHWVGKAIKTPERVRKIEQDIQRRKRKR